MQLPADVNEDKKCVGVSLPILGKMSLDIKKRLIRIFLNDGSTY